MVDRFPSLLCADGDAALLERLTEYFTGRGFIVLTATNGVEACLQVKRWAPSAVILDLFIPRLGGIGALGRIRAIDPVMPVILTSTTSDALALVTGAGLSVAGTFVKPLDLDRISETLARAGVVPPVGLAADDAPPFPRPGRGRILVVDDEAEFREVLAEYLAGKGFDAREAGSGEEALGQVVAFEPHIVLLDLVMPGLGGLETLRQLKTLAPDSRVIIVTAVEELTATRSALALGAADYVTKPFPLPYLDGVLEIHMALDLADSGVPRAVDHSTVE